MTVRANKPAFNIREKLKELTHSIGLKGRELMRAATVQEARDLVSAGRRNMIINGDMRIAQRGTSQNITPSDTQEVYAVDRLQFAFERGDLSTTISQSTDAPDGFSNSAKVEVTTAGTDWCLWSYKFEGQDVQHLGYGTSKAKPVTLSFWVKSNLPGQYTAELYNTDSTRSISYAYTIDKANTWQKITHTFPGDTVGTFNNDNEPSLQVSLFLDTDDVFTGGTFQSNWAATSNVNRAVGNVRFSQTLGNDFYITGLQLELGKNATEFEHRSYGEELALCQRYFFYGYVLEFSPVSPYSSNYTAFVNYPVPMRAHPELTAGNVQLHYSNLGTNNVTDVSNLVDRPGNLGTRVFFTPDVTWSGSTPSPVSGNGTLSATLEAYFDAEL